jgi:hypothetical protein
MFFLGGNITPAFGVEFAVWQSSNRSIRRVRYISREATPMKKNILPVVSILIGSMAFPIWAAEDAKAVPPRVYGQPVTNVPAPIQPATSVSATAQPVSTAPVTAQPASAVPAAVQPVATPVAAGQPATGIPVAKPSQQAASNKSRLTFMDSKLFDVKLSKELESGKEIVEVDVSGRVPLSNIPGRIDKWVVKSAEEGKVELLQSEPAPKTRFIFSLIPMVFNAVGFMKNVQEEKIFDHAKNYDTKIYYKKDESGETLIEKIVMTRRKP